MVPQSQKTIDLIAFLGFYHPLYLLSSFNQFQMYQIVLRCSAVVGLTPQNLWTPGRFYCRRGSRICCCRYGGTSSSHALYLLRNLQMNCSLLCSGSHHFRLLKNYRQFDFTEFDRTARHHRKKRCNHSLDSNSGSHFVHLASHSFFQLVKAFYLTLILLL